MKLITRLLVLFATISYISGEREQYVTCDFDLVDQVPEILKYLPKYCQGIKTDSELYAKYKEDSEKFKEFNIALEEYKEKPDPSSKSEGKWEKRFELYNKTMLFTCSNNSESQIQFLDCLIEKRNKMISELKLATDNISSN